MEGQFRESSSASDSDRQAAATTTWKAPSDALIRLPATKIIRCFGLSLPVPAAAGSGMLEDGHRGRLGRRASSLPHSRQLRQPPHSHPSPPQPTRPGRRWRMSKLPPAAEDATAGSGRTKVGRTGAMACDDVKQRSNNFSQQFL